MRQEGFGTLILAGGRGSRLYPFTASLPKPLLPIGDQPVIDLIGRRLVGAGASHITVAVNYLAGLIESYLAAGERYGVPLDYLRETQPLGTAGPIGLMAPWQGPLVVTNADVLSDVDYQALIAEHIRMDAALTVATTLRTVRIDSGVLTTSPDGRVIEIVEKPTVSHRISMGIYVLAPRALDRVPKDQYFEMPRLITDLVDAGETVQAYDHPGFWLDIGQPEDFATAQNDPTIIERMLHQHTQVPRATEKL